MTAQSKENEGPGAGNFLQEFSAKAERLHIPISGSIELTHRCNLDCVHCYLGARDGRIKRAGMELGTERIISLLDEITAAGCLNLLITGGEPLLRDDFPAVYTRAKKNGLLVTLFTNGTLLTDRALDLFVDLPPREIEISVYGATASTYEEITRVPGSYEKCLHGIERLIKKNITVNLKTIIMTINRHEIEEIERLAKELGAKFRFDAAISPCINGDKTPMRLRVPPEEAVKHEFSSAEKREDWRKFYEKFRGRTLGDTVYACSAGVTGFHVDPFGYLQACMTTADGRCDISSAGFMAAWEGITQSIGKKVAPADFLCRGCEKVNLCGYCPDFFRLENGVDSLKSEYICKMGSLRLKYINDSNCSGG